MQSGDRVGAYEIVGLVGKGGMGEVYRARDAELGRDVAIKVLPAELAADEERLGRLRREARALASLNHPGIASVHGFQEHDGTRFIVMEMVEGETLADRIDAGGKLPVDTALRYAIKIAAALEAAHDAGIVHRDLKPANIKVTPQGDVKVLDFGLALTLGGGAQPDQAESPTLTLAATQAGVILGTAGYMSPEQARGLEVDRRTDVWALGVVLLEMLTGERTFKGELVTDTMAAVIKDDPRLDRLPAGAPAAVRRLLDRCLRKDPADRFHDVADVRLLLQDAMEQEPEVAPESAAAASRRPLPAGAVAAIALAGLIVGAAAVYLLAPDRAPTTEAMPTRSFVLAYGDLRDSRAALAHDSQRLAYSHDGRIWIRNLRDLEAIPVPGTEGGTVPFWSPDGEWLGYVAEGAMWKVRLDGTGRVRITSRAPSVSAGGSVWLPDDRILFDTGSSPIFVVSARGGDATTLVPLQEGEADFHDLAGLPDGRGALTVLHRGLEFRTILLITPDGERREIFSLPRGDSIGKLAYSATGHIVFERFALPEYALWAVAFSVDEMQVTGEPFPVVPGAANPTLGSDGTLIYVPTLPQVDSELVLVDRAGAIAGRVGKPMRGLYSTPAISPDGQTVVAPVMGAQGMDLWAFDLGADAPRRLTFDNSLRTVNPSWSPDGQYVYFARMNTLDFGIYRVPAAGGSPEVVAKTGGFSAPAFTRDGRTMLYNEFSEGFNWDLWRRDLDVDRPGEPLLADAGWELGPALSPDDRYVAYFHNGNVFVRGFPDMAGPWQIGPGAIPRWSPDGTRLYWLDGGRIMEARVTTDDAFRFETPTALASVDVAPVSPNEWPSFDVTPDGERFLMVRTLEQPPGLILLQNWLGSVE